jgi:tRNA G18 (ribose-2'-O)-methylase SpoU
MSAPYADWVSKLPREEVKDALNSVRRPVEVAVYGSKNCWNFGAILRIGHNNLISKYYAIDIPWYYPKAAMTARVWERDLIEDTNQEGFLKMVEGRNVVAFEKRKEYPKENHDLRFFTFPENPILLFGAEDFGIPPALMERADSIVTIPCHGLVFDHNVANACGIALYEWDKQYTLKKP